MQLALTLTLLAATSTAITVHSTNKVASENSGTYEHNNCGKYDVWEDCRAEAHAGATSEEYDKCIDDLEEQFWTDCDKDSECMEPHWNRFLEVMFDYDCLQDDDCTCPDDLDGR